MRIGDELVSGGNERVPACFKMTEDNEAVMAWAEEAPHDAAKLAVIMDTATEMMLRHRVEVARFSTAAIARQYSKGVIDRLGLLLAALAAGYEGLLAEREATDDGVQKMPSSRKCRHCRPGDPCPINDRKVTP